MGISTLEKQIQKYPKCPQTNPDPPNSSLDLNGIDAFSNQITSHTPHH